MPPPSHHGLRAAKFKYQQDLLFIDGLRKDKEREKKMEMLMMEIKEPAIEIYLNLNKSGVPIVHESRVINVSPAAMELARELGVERIFGLRLA